MIILVEILEERAIFCTFVMLNNQTTHLIKWSKQFNNEKQEFYTVDVSRWTQRDIPEWAVNKLVAFHHDKKLLMPHQLKPQHPES